jgi:dipeptidyl aminopeptidase/acylaminoacyl peptidase
MTSTQTDIPTTPRAITAEDLYAFELITEIALSPDGRRILYGVQRVDRESEKKYVNLWLIDQDGTGAWRAPRPFTTGDQNDGAIRWSPDGRQIAFLSNRGGSEEEKKQAQIYLIPVDGGEARKLTKLQGQVSEMKWSPDGSALLLEFRQKDAEAIEREKDERKKKLGVVARHITRLSYKSDGVGFLPKERLHLWRLDPSTGEMSQLTQGEVQDEYGADWSPDGSQIVYVSNSTEDPDRYPLHTEIYLMPATGLMDGEHPRQLTTFAGRKGGPVFSPDGQWIAFVGSQGLDQFWRSTDIWLVPADGSGPARNITGHLDINVGNSTLGDTSAGRGSPEVMWSEDGSRLIFSVARHGRVTLHTIDPFQEQAQPQTVVNVHGLVSQFDQVGEGVAYVLNSSQDPCQVWFTGGDGSQGEGVCLTRLNRDLLEQIHFGERQEIWIDGPAGQIQGWIMTPPDFDPGQSYPGILEIHGGPMLQYGESFMHEFHWLAAQGYVVFFTNPRGSQGYGNDFVSANKNNFGGHAYDDLMAWTDYVAALPYVDDSRLGVTGGSYGGYMTNWIIGHTDRFQAAVTQRSLSNLISFNGSSDVHLFELMFSDGPTWQNLEDYWRQSPIAYLDNMVTPTLVIHSEQDLRVAMEQGEQIFVFLKLKGVETELVRFPEESHGLSRSGRTDRRIARLEHILRWFDRYLR